jgi:tetratricopeptide (TPR) repeat protein
MVKQEWVNHRYRLHQVLGAGGMGIVYRATDVLHGEDIVLKRVIRSDHANISQSQSLDARLSLIHEFKMLASLRHPHIIGVLDFGFDADQLPRTPYYTMRLLRDAQTIVEAGLDLSQTQRTQLLLDALQALEYLHQRKILHRDIKPHNLLVELDGDAWRVQLLDFGLSQFDEDGDSTEIKGTLTYMAPELLRGQKPSPASDIYAMGMIAYEMLTGTYPFNQNNMTTLIQEILHTAVDLDVFEEERVRDLFDRWLTKDPQARFQDVRSLMVDFCQAFNVRLPVESEELRDSMLQTGRFVGRDDDLMQLTTALKRAMQRQGSLWLVGGESGVGKSRLVDELRTRALVTEYEAQSVLSLRGQNVEGSAVPYAAWREPVRQLALYAPFTPLQASILKAIAPDLPRLLKQDVHDAPAMEGKGAVQRLAETLVEVLRRVPQPILITLEDLHWAEEDLVLLQKVAPFLATLPVLVVASYRDDEAPQLHEQLPTAQRITLKRLSSSATHDLLSSILGDVPDEMTDVIHRESEGNALFIVEALRTMAENSDHLHNILSMTLPQALFAEGIETVMQGRFARTPQWAHRLMRYAALIGRDLQLPLLKVLIEAQGLHVDLDEWLTVGANRAILEQIDGQWRFTHDKLRTAVARTADDAPIMHRHIAQAIESLSAGDVTLASRLAYHWREAGDSERELYALREASMQITRIGALDRALGYQRRIMMLVSEMDDQAEVARAYFGLGRTLRWLGQLEEAGEYLEQGITLAREVKAPYALASALKEMAIILSWRGDYETATRYLEESLTISVPNGYKAITISNYYRLGTNALTHDKKDEAEMYFQKGIDASLEDDNLALLCTGYVNMGTVAAARKDNEKARHLFQESIRVAEQVGYKLVIGAAYLNLGLMEVEQELLTEGESNLRRSLQIFDEINSMPYAVASLVGLGEFYCRQGDVERGLSLAYLGGHHASASDEELLHAQRIKAMVADKLDEATLERFWLAGAEQDVMRVIQAEIAISP